MVSRFISVIYERTCYIVRSAFEENEEVLRLYYEYLRDKYEGQIKIIIDSESVDMASAIVDSLVEDEIKIWTGLSQSEMMSLLEPDPAFEHLIILSEIAFEQAIEYAEKHNCYDNEAEYRRRLAEVEECFNAVRPFNTEAAQDVLSEAILDIDYIFGKSENTSFRLSHVI